MMRHDPFANPAPLIRRVYAYVAYRIGDGADAEDVTSDTFERALRYRDSFDPRKGDPAAWLVGIARRCVDDFFVRRRTVVRDPPETAAPGDLEREIANRAELAAAMRRLDDRDRELLSLRYGADLTARQIAELLDLKTNAVEVALHRALGRLRVLLTESDAPRELASEPARASL